MAASIQRVSNSADLQFCTNPIAEKLYRAGTALLRPFEYQANLATKLFSPSFRPGKSFADLNLAQKIWKVLRICTVCTLVIPLITGLLALVGTLLRVIGLRFSPTYTIQQNDDRHFKTLSDDEDLTATSYNVGLMPGYIRNLNNLRSSNKRAQEIGTHGDFLERNSHVICFQECFDEEATSILCDSLKEIYPHILRRVDPNAAGLGSGLVIASQFEIQEVHQGRFEMAKSEDAFAHKGFVGVRLKLNEEKDLWVYTTHLQAKTGEEYSALRSQQIAFLIDQIPPERKALVLGDFNISRKDENERDTSEVPTSAFGERFGYIFENFSMEIEMDKLSSWYNVSDLSWGKRGWNKAAVPGCQYDHAYLSINSSWRGNFTILKLEDDSNLVSGYSDHLPIRVQLTPRRSIYPQL